MNTPARTLPPLKSPQDRVVLDPWIEVMPVTRGERVPCMGTSARELGRVLEAAFGISINRKGESVIRLRKKDGADHALKGLSAFLKEGDNSANEGKEPFRFLLDRLEEHGEIEVRYFGQE